MNSYRPIGNWWTVYEVLKLIATGIDDDAWTHDTIVFVNRSVGYWR